MPKLIMPNINIQRTGGLVEQENEKLLMVVSVVPPIDNVKEPSLIE
ncbi:hypothetical protein [Peribacillus asahii]|nr:hypothetical protein [Peribacillus asahii]USK61649.1 hypothetical protein LIT37_10195 [Peribacillus asahii]